LTVTHGITAVAELKGSTAGRGAVRAAVTHGITAVAE
jgi:hypothetical protein